MRSMQPRLNTAWRTLRHAMGKGRFGAVLVLVALGSATTACSQVSSKPSAASSTAIPKTWSLVALGDSVPRGANCDWINSRE